MNSTIYFGETSWMYDDDGNSIIQHEVGGLRFGQVFDETQQLNKLLIEGHIGNKIYVEITEFI